MLGFNWQSTKLNLDKSMLAFYVIEFFYSNLKEIEMTWTLESERTKFVLNCT